MSLYHSGGMKGKELLLHRALEPSHGFSTCSKIQALHPNLQLTTPAIQRHDAS